MAVFRLYTGSDGESHIEPLKVAELQRVAATAPIGTITFSEDAPGTFFDWHPAPRRQWVVILSGQLEIGLGDGTRRRFGPGDARLVEDTTGHGHTTRVTSDQPCLVMVVPVDEQPPGG
jgi:quercetin dioxygenase-like cupin family protein